MKVMKFGGTSVGSPESLQLVKNIIIKEEEPVIVVVSALNGVTDRLLLSRFAYNGNSGYKTLLDEIIQRHRDIIETLSFSNDDRQQLVQDTEQLFDELQNILRGVFLIGDLSQKTSDKIVSYGERLSSLIVNKLITGSQLYDSQIH